MTECEICQEREWKHFLSLSNDTHAELLATMLVCDECYEKHEFTVGAIEWEDNQ